MITQAEVNQYKQQGFIYPVDIFKPQEIAGLNIAIDEHLSGKFESEQYELCDPIEIKNIAPEGENAKYAFVVRDTGKPKLHTFPFLFNLFKVDDRFLKAAQHPNLVKTAQQLLDTENILLFEDNIIIKKPHSRRIPWHQDYSYWPLGDTSVVTFWIALHDVDGSNGAMEVAPGTQAEGECLPIAFGDLSTFMERERPHARQVSQKPEELGYPIVSYELKAGQAGAHDAMVWHGSTPNSTDSERRVYVLRYAAEGTQWLGDSRMPYYDIDCKVGEGLNRRHFPLVNLQVKNPDR